jgi:excisionase family DNA binding protein
MTPVPARRWITVQEAAEYIDLHLWTVRKMIARGLIPAVRLGRAVRVDLRALGMIDLARIPSAKIKKSRRLC